MEGEGEESLRQNTGIVVLAARGENENARVWGWVAGWKEEGEADTRK